MDGPGVDGGDATGGDPDGQSGDGGNDVPDEDTDGQPGSDGEDGRCEDGPGDGLDPDGSSDEVFEDRALRLLVTFQGAGVLHGELTPECAEIVNTVLDELAVPAGPEDDRDLGQRYHDALQEAMR